MQDLSGGVVLLDVMTGEGGEFDRSMLERLGHPVLVCHGPGAAECPLLAGTGCSKFEQAHGVVFELDLDRPEHSSVVSRYRKLARPEMPIRRAWQPVAASFTI